MGVPQKRFALDRALALVYINPLNKIGRPTLPDL